MKNVDMFSLTFETVLSMIARDAQLFIDLGHLEPEQAVTTAAQSYLTAGEMAAKRVGPFAANLSKESAEAYGFYRSVAADVRDNNQRPSVGHCRDYVLAMLNTDDTPGM